jgi:tight adherence protein B
MQCRAYDVLSALAPAAIILLLGMSASATLLLRDVAAGRLRERVSAIRTPGEAQAAAEPVRTLGIRSDKRGEWTVRLMSWLRLNPDIRHQNIIAWKLVIAIACGLALGGFFYGREFLGWPLAALAMPLEAFFTARFIFGWERARYQKAMLEQIPDVMAMICRAVAAGIPFTEALNSVAREAASPSRDEFVRVVSEMTIGQPLEAALWKLQERVGLPEYAFFAVTIGLQAQTGGSLVETLRNLQDMVRKRVALSKRGKALAAEARMSATILGALPFVAGAGLTFIRPGFLDFFFYTPTGNHLLLYAFGFLGTGIMVMRQLIGRSLAP